MIVIIFLFVHHKSRALTLSQTWHNLQSILSMGAFPCHINVDRNLGFMFISNYLGGNFLAQSINKETGEITEDFVSSISYGAGKSMQPKYKRNQLRILKYATV